MTILKHDSISSLPGRGMDLLISMLVAVLFLVPLCSCEQQQARIVPQDLRCEFLVDPAVVDVPRPRLSWVNLAARGSSGAGQRAYQLRVSTTNEGLGDPEQWTSDKMLSDESSRVVYGGPNLASQQTYWWQVRVWDDRDQVSAWSKPGFWRMGILDSSEWQAQWIGAPWQDEDPIPRPANYPNERPDDFGPPAPHLRKEFSVEKEVDEAVMFVTGLGYFELQVNGEKVSDDLLVPNQTNYGKRPRLPDYYINLPDDFQKYKVMYMAYDVKDLLSHGDNAVGAILGNGFYNPAKFWADGYGVPRLLGQLKLTYTDGTEEVIVTDETWKVSPGPILMNMVYYGETYDARLELDGWSHPDYNDSEWELATAKAAPEGELVAHTAYPDRVTKVLQPQRIRTLDNGNYFVDFGEEISGWVRLKGVNGPSGHEISLVFNSNQYSGDNVYICNGKPDQSYAPRFNWFVFSGVEVVNWPGELTEENISAEAVNTYIEATATFETSNPLLNDINRIWRRSQEDNMHGGIASDCPHRERSGYTGDGQVACATVLHNYDARNFYYKWIEDIRESQIVSTGYVPNGAPWQPGCGGGVAWGAAICIMPWEFYQHYGALDMLEDNYAAMKGYVAYLEKWRRADGVIHSQRTNGSGQVLKWFNLGEWVAPGDLPPDELVHSFYFWRCADITSQVASILGRSDESLHYAAVADQVKEAFHEVFYDEESGSYGDGGGDVLALRMGVPADREARVVEALKANVLKNEGHLDTGIFGTRFFFEVLAQHGMNEMAYNAITKTTEPGFGHWLTLGSTTTREKWDEGGSHNHPMFGGGLVYLYRNLAGMQRDASRPGYQHIIFKPQPVLDLDYVTYYNDTVYGQAGIDWRQDSDSFRMRVTVPVGAEATVYVPGDQVRLENSEVIDGAADTVEEMGKEGGYQVFKVLSGSYSFIAAR